MSTPGRSSRRRKWIYDRALRHGIQVGLEAAEREARICAISWDGASKIAAGTVADQIAKIEISEDEIQQMVEDRNGGDAS